MAEQKLVEFLPTKEFYDRGSGMVEALQVPQTTLCNLVADPLYASQKLLKKTLLEGCKTVPSTIYHFPKVGWLEDCQTADAFSLKLA